MIVLYIILGIVAYFIFGSIITGILIRNDSCWNVKNDGWNLPISITIFYPILVPLAIVVTACEKIIKKIGKIPE